jgi:hypothetical protein
MDKVYREFDGNFIRQGSKAYEEFLADWKTIEGYRLHAAKSYVERSTIRRWFRV